MSDLSLTANPDAGANSNPEPTDPGVGAQAAGEATPNPMRGEGGWKSTLPQELLSEPSLNNINDIETLAKSYVHAQKMVGRDKIAVPGKDADTEEWINVFRKLGLPEQKEEYALKPKDTFQLEEDILSAFKDTAFEKGILPSQAQGILEWYQDTLSAQQTAFQDEAALHERKAIESLEQEWGADLAHKVETARRGLHQFADESTVQYLEQKGLQNDPVLVKLFEKVGSALKEGGFKAESVSSFGKSAADLQAEINTILEDPGSPAFDNKHPKHASTVAKLEDLHKRLSMMG